MPKVVLSTNHQYEKQITYNIRAIGAKNGCRYDKDIARHIQMPTSTFCNKMKHPKTFTLADLIQISESFKLQVNDILAR